MASYGIIKALSEHAGGRVVSQRAKLLSIKWNSILAESANTSPHSSPINCMYLHFFYISKLLSLDWLFEIGNSAHTLIKYSKVAYGKAITLLNQNFNAGAAFLITSPYSLLSVIRKAINSLIMPLVQELSHGH